MRDLPTRDELKKTQDIITAVPHGPWEIRSAEPPLLPDSIGPVSYIETWVDSDRVPVLKFIEHARDALPRYMGAIARLTAERGPREEELESLRAEVDAARRYAEEMRGYCSPHGVAGMYADRLVGRMDRAKGGVRHGR